jgi:hypothetical protein
MVMGSLNFGVLYGSGLRKRMYEQSVVLNNFTFGRLLAEKRFEDGYFQMRNGHLNKKYGMDCDLVDRLLIFCRRAATAFQNRMRRRQHYRHRNKDDDFTYVVATIFYRAYNGIIDILTILLELLPI